MYSKKKVIIIITSLSIMLISSIILLLMVIREKNQKLNHIEWISLDYQIKIDELEKNNVKYVEQYYLIKNELDQRNKINPKLNYSVYHEKEKLLYRTIYALDLRTDITPNCAIITTIPEGATINVINSFFGNIWEVEYKGNKGWVDANGTLEKI